MSPNGVAKIDFKRAQAKDLPEVASWIKRYYTYDHIPYHETQVKSGLWTLLETGEYGSAYFVSLGTETIGYFILTYAFDIEFGGRHAVLTDLFFSEAARRTGAGTKTLRFIEALCVNENINSLLLQVESDNHEAQRFYKKSGIETLSRHILVKNLGNRTS